MASKSANYCWASPAQPKGVLILSEVALGETTEVTEATDEEMDFKITQSIHGLGRMQPTPDTHEHLMEESSEVITVPIGTPEPVPIDSSLLYNEYVVYAPERQRIRYLVLVHFDFVS